MRIIGGKYRGRNIIAPRNIPTRPTTDFAKEALFNILTSSFDFEEVHMLDLFAGTGNISYEFLSRGGMKTTSVDLNFKCVSFMKSMMKTLGEDDNRVVRSEVFKFLDREKMTYPLIFADPPYELENIADIHKKVFENNLLEENGWLIVEHAKETDLSDLEHHYETRRYGNVNFSIFQL